MTTTCKRDRCTNVPWSWGHGYCTKHARAGLAILDGHGRVPADHIRAHLRSCINAGASPERIDRGCGVGHGTTNRILRGQRTVQTSTARRLASATPEMGNARPAWPIRRRVQALRAAGWLITDLAAAWGMSPSGVENLCQEGRTYVQPATDRAVREFYDEHAFKPVPPAPEKTAAHGWCKPFDWSCIDDPDEYHGGKKIAA